MFTIILKTLTNHFSANGIQSNEELKQQITTQNNEEKKWFSIPPPIKTYHDFTP